MISLQSLLKEGRPLVGLTTQHVTEPWLAKIWKASGCDLVFLEYEHGFFNERDLASFVLCCRAEGLPVVAKVPECTRAFVAKLLDAGVTGIQLPWTESKEQIDRLVSYIKFPPLGIRAACPGYGSCDYDLDITGEQFVETANRETVVVAHVETRIGVEHIDEIVSNPQVDVLFIGMYDLSISYGHPGDMRHPDLTAAVERVFAAARKNNKVLGMFVPDPELARIWLDAGVTFYESQSEVDLIASGARSLVATFRAMQAPPVS
jgi:2-keto-3-deoxy-L-rhamnonate aldolase RhmA